MEPRTMLPRLFILGLLATEVIGLVGGLTDESWGLGFTGWCMGSTLYDPKVPLKSPISPTSSILSATRWYRMGQYGTHLRKSYATGVD